MVRSSGGAHGSATVDEAASRPRVCSVLAGPGLRDTAFWTEAAGRPQRDAKASSAAE